ncbi:MAG: GTPase HflX, partial [Betaproteobacteria bacterium]|nr:GTPase HflX [Betaproteobacteria bacterium]
MSETRPGPDRAVIVGLDFGQYGFPESLEELGQLALSAGIKPVATITGRRSRPDPALYAGKGKAGEISAAARAHGANLVVFNHQLSPAQERNLNNVLGARVVDRTALILDIFGQRAHSRAGKLQVELAQLEHISTRLVRSWTHLERQRGGHGMMGGMGETQLEIDRRLIGNRVKLLKDELRKLDRQRRVQRRARTRGGVFSASLVGYTNAGKSTLFNALTHAQSYAANQLFATLDTTSRKLYLGGFGQIVVSDTVGFIRELPHTLVEAFRATLEETIRADVLIHVADSASPGRAEQVAEVDAVLAEIGASDVPQIMVWNKTDASGLGPGVERDEYGKICRVRLSARTGAGVELLREALIEAASARNAPPAAEKNHEFQDPVADL